MKSHTYNAYCQWHAHAQSRVQMDETSAGTIEDYQENLTVEYSEMPTSMGFTSNRTTVALYSIEVRTGGNEKERTTRVEYNG